MSWCTVRRNWPGRFLLLECVRTVGWLHLQVCTAICCDDERFRRAEDWDWRPGWVYFLTLLAAHAAISDMRTAALQVRR